MMIQSDGEEASHEADNDFPLVEINVISMFVNVVLSLPSCFRGRVIVAGGNYTSSYAL